MASLSEIYKKLTGIKDPETGESLFSLGLIKDVSLTENVLSLTLVAANEEEMKNFENMVLEALEEYNYSEIKINKVYKKIERPRVSKQGKTMDKRIEGVKKIIAVGSGKGGVGKSTVAANLAVALKETGLTVGLFDGDIYGPSISRMFGIDGIAPLAEDNMMIPAERFGIKIMSMGQLVEEERPILWRGPLVHKAYEQFFFQTRWAPLDVLVIDLPPGTGDAQLSAIQLLNLDGAIIVTTPQDVSLIEVKKAINMFRESEVEVLGVVENMSYFKCPHCGNVTRIFGEGGAKKLRETMNVEILGEIPVYSSISISGDEGIPVIINSEMVEDEIKLAFTRLALRVREKTGL